MTAAPQAPAAQAQAPALALRDASIAPAGAAQPLLCGLRLQIAPGEQVALIGASGSGKSTLMLALAGAWPLQAGALHWYGQDPWQLPRSQRQRLRREMFYAPQVPPLPPRQRVVAAVLAGRLPHMGLAASLRTLWHPRRTDAQWAQQALLALDLPDKLWQRVDRLSGGERQRVGLARLLASQARCWLVDEPLSALDPSRAQQVMQVLRQTARQRGNTLLCSLHQVDAARRFARVLALKDGAIAYDGPGSGLSDALLLQLYGSTALDDAPADVQAAVQAQAAPSPASVWAGPAPCG